MICVNIFFFTVCQMIFRRLSQLERQNYIEKLVKKLIVYYEK